MIKTSLKLWACATAFSLALASFAATPVVVWDGDFGTTTKTGTDGNTYTIIVGDGNTLKDGVITIGLSVGAMIALPENVTDYTLLVRYSNLTAQKGAVLAATADTTDGGATIRYNNFGMCTQSGDAATGLNVIGFWGTRQEWNFGSSAPSLTEGSGYFLHSYSVSSGTYGATGSSAVSLAGGTAGGLHFTGTGSAVAYASIGGLIVPSTQVNTYAGLKIEAVALYVGSDSWYGTNANSFAIPNFRTVVWDGDLGATKTGIDGNTYSITVGEGNTLKDGVITIGSSVGATIDLPSGVTEYSLLVRYSGLTAKQGAVLAATDDGGGNTDFGLCTKSGDEETGLNVTGFYKANRYALSDPAPSLSSGRGYFQHSYSVSSGTYGSTGGSVDSLAGGTAGGLHFSNLTVARVSIGGLSGTEAENVSTYAGLKIEAIALCVGNGSWSCRSNGYAMPVFSQLRVLGSSETGAAFADNAWLSDATGDNSAFDEMYKATIRVSGSAAIAGNGETVPFLRVTGSSGGSLAISGTLTLGGVQAEVPVTLASGGTFYLGTAREFSGVTVAAGATVYLTETLADGGSVLSRGLTVEDGATVIVTGFNGEEKTLGANYTFTPTIDGAATVLDITFTNTIAIAYTTDSNAGTYRDVAPVYNDDGTGVMLKSRVYTENFGDTLTKISPEMTVVVAGEMSPTKKTTFLHIGSTTSDTATGLLFATTDKDNEVLIAWNTGSTVQEITTMTVPNPTSRHVYAITKIDGESATTFKIYLDGILWTSFSTESVYAFTAGGVQVGADFGGGIRSQYAAVANSATETSVINLIRMFDCALPERTIRQFSAEYPYISPSGRSSRTFTGTDEWWYTADQTWAYLSTSESSTLQKPAADSMVYVTSSGSGVTVTLNDAGSSYETLEILGDPITFKNDAGNTTGSPTFGQVTLYTTVTNVMNALYLQGGPLTIAEGGKLVADFSDFDFDGLGISTNITLTGVADADAAVEAYAGDYTSRLSVTHDGTKFVLTIVPRPATDPMTLYVPAGGASYTVGGAASSKFATTSGGEATHVYIAGDTIDLNGKDNVTLSLVLSADINFVNASGATLGSLAITNTPGVAITLGEGAKAYSGDLTLSGKGIGSVTVDGALTVDGTLKIDGGGLSAGSVSAGAYAFATASCKGMANASTTYHYQAQLAIDTPVTMTSLSGSGVVAGSGALTIQVADAATTNRFVGSVTGSRAVTKTGAGTLELFGTNSYTGGLTIEAGTVKLLDLLELSDIGHNYDASRENVFTYSEEDETEIVKWQDTLSPEEYLLPASYSGDQTYTYQKHSYDEIDGYAAVVSDGFRMCDSLAKKSKSFFMVGYNTDSSNYGSFMGDWSDCGNSSGIRWHMSSRNNTRYMRRYGTGGSSSWSSADLWKDGVLGVQDNAYGGISVPFAKAVVSAVSPDYLVRADSKSSDATRQCMVGGGKPMVWHEWLTFTREVTFEEKTAVEAWLMAKWGIGSAVYSPLPETGAVTIAPGAVLDCGGQSPVLGALALSGWLKNGMPSVSGTATFAASGKIDIGSTAIDAWAMPVDSVAGFYRQVAIYQNGRQIPYHLFYDTLAKQLVLRGNGFSIHIK